MYICIAYSEQKIMPYQFFLIPVRQADEAAAAMNQFLSTRRVLSVDRRWVDQGADSFWSFCVDYLDAPPKSDTGRTVFNVCTAFTG